MHNWITDSEASKHVCSNSLKHILNYIVTLPNNIRTPANLCGDVKLGPQLIIRDVLFVLQFQFNLISVTALTTSGQLNVHFFPDYFVLQDLRHQDNDWGKKNVDLYIPSMGIMNEKNIRTRTLSESFQPKLFQLL